MKNQIFIQAIVLLGALTSSVFASLYSQSGACKVVGCFLHCDNGLNYDLSAISDGGASGTGAQTVYNVVVSFIE